MSDFPIIDQLALLNGDSQYSKDNFKRIGNSVIVSPVEAVGDLIPANALIGLGFFEPDAQMAPTTDVQRNPILVQNPMGGPPVTLLEDASDISIVYENVEPVTADKYIDALHLGGSPTAVAGVGGGTVTINPFEPGASILARLFVLRLLEGAGAEKRFELLVHLRAAIQADGFGEYEGRTTRNFRIPVQAYGGTLTSAALKAYAPQMSSYGAIFKGTVADLPALWENLKTEGVASAVAPEETP